MNPASVVHPFPEDLGHHRRPAPLLPAAVGMACGIAADDALSIPLIAYLACAVVAAALLAVGHRRRSAAPAASFIVMFAVGAVWHDGSTRRVPHDHVVRFVGDTPVTARVTGTVLSDPRTSSADGLFFGPWMYRAEQTRFLINTQRIETAHGSVPTSGTMVVKLPGTAQHVHAGDTVELFGRLHRPMPPANPGQFDYARWQQRRGIHVAMLCPSARVVTVTARGGWRSHLARLRLSARAAFNDDERAVGDDETALLETMVLGARYAAGPKTERLFVHTGTVHFLAVSGAHVGVIAAFVWFFARRLGASRRGGAIAVILVLLLYACVVDPRPPILRATIIGLVYCTGMLLRRTPCAANSLALAMIVLLALRPADLFAPGFQMSFAGAAAISYLSHPLLNAWDRAVHQWRLPDDPTAAPPAPLSMGRRVLRGMYRIFCSWAAVSTAACLASTPLIGVHFGRIAPAACVFSLLLLPFFTVTVFTGFAAVVAGLVSPLLLDLVKPIADASAGVLLFVVRAFARVSPEFTGVWRWVFVAVYSGLVVVLVGSIRIGSSTLAERFRRWFARSVRGADRWHRAAIGLLGAPLAVMGCVAVLAGRTNGEGSLRVTQLAVARGSATVIEFPGGEVWLYDCGTNRPFDVGAATIVPFCAHRGIDRIDRIVISHPNMDHFSGLFSILDAVPAGPVALNAVFEPMAAPNGPADAMLNELRRRAHPIEIIPAAYGAETVGDVVVETLWPPAEPGSVTTTNDASTVLRLTYRGRSILLCGDVEEDAVAALMERGDLHADVLVLPHHGSVERNTTDLLSAVNPAVCVRSSDQPTADASAALRDAVGGRPHFNTADDGAVTIEIDGAGLSVRGFLARGFERNDHQSKTGRPMVHRLETGATPPFPLQGERRRGR